MALREPCQAWSRQQRMKPKARGDPNLSTEPAPGPLPRAKVGKTFIQLKPRDGKKKLRVRRVQSAPQREDPVVPLFTGAPCSCLPCTPQAHTQAQEAQLAVGHHLLQNSACTHPIQYCSRQCAVLSRACCGFMQHTGLYVLGARVLHSRA